MRIRFFASDKPREKNLARAVRKGAAGSGARIEILPLCATPDIAGADAVCMVGVKSKRLFRRCQAAGVVPVMFDKGYVRTRRADARIWEYWRVSVGAHHPTRFLDSGIPKRKRFDDLDLPVERWRGFGFQIVLAGSSAKYHDFYDLPDPTAWATDVVAELRRLTDRPIIYRPKPSWRDAVPIEGTHFSRGSENIGNVLANSWALVTHGSNACFEAAVMGIPSIILGDGVAKPISATKLDAIEDPPMNDRSDWLARLAWWQWTEREMERGRMWKFLRPYIEQEL